MKGDTGLGISLYLTCLKTTAASTRTTPTVASATTATADSDTETTKLKSIFYTFYCEFYYVNLPK